MLEKSRAQIELALPRHMSPDRMIRIAMTSIQKTPKLLECDPRTVIGAVIQSAQLGLECDGVSGQAYLVPYKNRKKSEKAGRDVYDCQLIPGYKGYLKLARNSGSLTDVQADVVKVGDQFDYRRGTDPYLNHRPADKGRGAVTHAYVVFGIRDGKPQFDVMTVDEIERIRKRSKNSGPDTPWGTDFDEMAKKTVLRRGSKLVPQSIEKDGEADRLAIAAGLEERAIAGRSQGLAVLADPGHIEDDEDDAPQEAEEKGDGMPRRASATAQDVETVAAVVAAVQDVTAQGPAVTDAEILAAEAKAAEEKPGPVVAKPAAPVRKGPTPDDPLISDSDRRGLLKQALFAKIDAKEVADRIKKMWGLSSTEELTVSEALELAEWMRRPAAER